MHLSQDVSRALELNLPVVALESTVITHGLPFPENLNLAEDMESEVRQWGATPATIAMVEGKLKIGLDAIELERLATGGENLLKISLRDIAPAMNKLASGGTTVAGTLFAAHKAGIRVFATGGIGGVHYEINRKRKGSFDISADLPALARFPVIVVCAGAKAILDLAATLEYLETWGVPVVGFQSDNFPAFYASASGYKTSAQANSPEEIASLAWMHWSLGMQSAVLVVAPPPEEVALPSDQVKAAVLSALRQAQAENITGQAVTPYLLQKVNEFTGGLSLRANLGLLRNNASIASQIARSLAQMAPKANA
ncbi:MAG: pseudouridine-5'-phosphate glycosidase [Anaerolineales bacterium]|nr:MAG: pseudouridine-5'-phosphate glycosidase [Anaerolineales bacterium]